MANNKRTLKSPMRIGKVSRDRITDAVRAVHVTPKPGHGWVVRKISGHRITAKFSTQKEAVEYARMLIRKQRSTAIIHGRDGKIRRLYSKNRADITPTEG